MTPIPLRASTTPTTSVGGRFTTKANMSKSSSKRPRIEQSQKHPSRPSDPARWWHAMCEVAPNIIISGGLPHDREHAKKVLNTWEDTGVTHYIAVHEECDNRTFVQRNSRVEYIKVGVDDDGSRRDPRWFDTTTTAALDALKEPDSKLLISCWLGVNRGPSATFAVLLSLGWEPIAALEAIRTVRPIAATIYAPDAIRWWGKRSGHSQDAINETSKEVQTWIRQNPLDLYHVMDAIGSRTGWR